MAKRPIISDIHGNGPALKAVLNYILKELDIQLENVINLGDTIGYYPFVNECLDLTRRLGIKTLKGNHCEGCSDDVEDLEKYFNENRWSPHSRPPVVYARKELESSPRNLEFLKNSAYIENENGFGYTHSNPISPGDFDIYLPDYLKPDQSGQPIVQVHQLVNSMLERILFVGHSHIPSITRLDEEDSNNYNIINDENIYQPFPLDDDRKYLINAGSVGQPRDGNKDACFCVFDEDTTTVQFHRVSYNIEETQKKTIEAKYGLALIRKAKVDEDKLNELNKKYFDAVVQNNDRGVKIDVSLSLSNRLALGK